MPLFSHCYIRTSSSAYGVVAKIKQTSVEGSELWPALGAAISTVITYGNRTFQYMRGNGLEPVLDTYKYKIINIDTEKDEERRKCLISIIFSLSLWVH